MGLAFFNKMSSGSFFCNFRAGFYRATEEGNKFYYFRELKKSEVNKYI